MIWLLWACTTSDAELPPPVVSEPVVLDDPVSSETPIDWSIYPFLHSTNGMRTLLEMFPTPKGYTRVELNDGSFGAWLRTLPVEDRQTVLAYNGSTVRSSAAAVVAMDVGRGDVQQCADSILRLYSEYLWHQNRVDDWGIHFTSGDHSTWKKWSQGERFSINGSKVNRAMSGRADSSYEQYQKWLRHSFLYAGTRSLHADSSPVQLDESVRPGDFFVSPGSPGHAILVLDVAQAQGHHSVALLGQGFMPAQEFHVLTASGRHVVADWFILPQNEGEALVNPVWSPLPRTGVYRFP